MAIKRVLLFVVIFLFLNCSKKKDNVKIDFLVKKRILYNDETITTAAMHYYQGSSYAIKQEFLFNCNGMVERIGINKGEGLFYFYRKDVKSPFSLSTNYPEYKDYKLIYNLKEKIIIDGNDTISKFNIDHVKKNISYVSEKEIVIYSFLEK